MLDRIVIGWTGLHDRIEPVLGGREMGAKREVGRGRPAGPDAGEEHVRFLREAVRIAGENVRAGGGGPFGAVVVKAGEVIGRGANRVTRTNDPTAHAEVVAIREACRTLGSFQLEGCDVYCSTEPCPMCLGALYWARPARVFYALGREAAAAAGFDDGYIYGELAKPPDERSLEMRGLELEDAEEPFRLWEEAEDRADY